MASKTPNDTLSKTHKKINLNQICLNVLNEGLESGKQKNQAGLCIEGNV